jgi:adenosine deaminase
MALSQSSVRALPKVELHCHIEGTMRPSTVIDLADTAGIDLPVDDPTEVFDYANLTEFLDVFWLVQSVLATPEAWARLAFESIIDGAEHGLIYRETFFTPARHLLGGQSLADIVAALDDGLASAEQSTGVVARLVFDIDREFGPAIALEHVEQLVALRRAGARGIERVLGVGMDSTERGIDPATYLDAYRAAGGAGFRLTAHQGENSPPKAAAAAVEILGCERLDHGVTVIDDPALVERLVTQRLPLTVCPNANVRINPDVFPTIAHHPFERMRDAGLLVTLNTDDPAMIDLDLTEEYLLTATAFGYEWDELVAIAVDAVEASWLDVSEKDAMAQRVRAGAARAIELEHGVPG